MALSEATAAALHGQIEHQTPQPVAAQPVAGASLAGRLLGFVGLLVAVLLLRGGAAKPTDEHAQRLIRKAAMRHAAAPTTIIQE